MILSRPRDAIQRTSPLVEALAAATSDGSRYALVGPEPRRVLPPNQEAWLGLRSIHSYDSLSPRAYQDWVLRVSRVGTRTRGRRFDRIADAALLSPQELALAGVGALACAERLEAPWLAPVALAGGMQVHRTRAAPLLFARFERWHGAADGGLALVDPLLSDARAGIACAVDEGDRQVYELEPRAAQTLAFLGRQHHPQWTARVDGAPAPVEVVDGFFAGVRLPAGARVLEVEFRPWVRWAWVPQLAFAAAAALALLQHLRRRRARA